MHVIYLELLLLLVLAVLNDTVSFRIDNKIILFFLTAGLVTGFARGGIRGLASSAAGALIPFILLFLLYLLKMLGAGDVKLLCAIGAIGGTGIILPAMAYSFLSGGFIAVIIMLVRKNAAERTMYFYSYLKACFLCHSLLQYSDFKDNNTGSRFRFSYAIACGTAIAVLLRF
jgi:prepilin peptidase CpaA